MQRGVHPPRVTQSASVEPPSFRSVKWTRRESNPSPNSSFVQVHMLIEQLCGYPPVVTQPFELAVLRKSETELRYLFWQLCFTSFCSAVVVALHALHKIRACRNRFAPMFSKSAVLIPRPQTGRGPAALHHLV